MLSVRRDVRFRWLLFAVVATACASAPPQPVRVVGNPADLEALRGEWLGHYEADTPGRAGSIVFRLSATSDSAFGDVLMSFQPPELPMDVMPAPAQLAKYELLSIRFVRVEHGLVSGLLGPYTDPVCGCRLSTTFTGRLQGNLIEGTYQSEHIGSNHVTTGRWRAARVEKKR